MFHKRVQLFFSDEGLHVADSQTNYILPQALASSTSKGPSLLGRVIRTADTTLLSSDGDATCRTTF
jgi:hypothetical protein